MRTLPRRIVAFELAVAQTYWPAIFALSDDGKFYRGTFNDNRRLEWQELASLPEMEIPDKVNPPPPRDPFLDHATGRTT